MQIYAHPNTAFLLVRIFSLNIFQQYLILNGKTLFTYP